MPAITQRQKEEKAGYDEKRLCRTVGIGIAVIALFVLASRVVCKCVAGKLCICFYLGLFLLTLL